MHPSGLPDSGQATCYNQRGVVINCANATCPGQDGFYAIGCPSEGRFLDNGDGTVTDICTGLIWEKETAPGTYFDWCLALSYCEGLTLAGHDDWRLPNVRELQSIVDYGRVRPAIDPVFGVLGESFCYWSSTSTARSGGRNKWSVVGDGAVVSGICSEGFYVRAVRSGP